jgi:ATP-binding cassette subfamily B protein
VLDHLELSLRAGECTALVGLNGAGKTTLVKLLARLYEPTEGALLIDGVDAAEFAVDSWRRQLAVIFQDFTRYELTAADNIAFGAVERRDDAVVRRSAERAGIATALDELPRGLDTLLARHYEDGGELSGGQWQRVAIARALYALDCGARVLVMDEPTSALDVRAEAEFFEQFRELTRGVTTLLISHRFSSVRHADRIVVLEHGRVIEDGTHESLVASGGRYADLFTLQAERFAAGLDADGNPTDDRELV